jgi:hypothetical protein
MKKLTIKRYNTSFKKEWDSFIAENNSFTFLFYRDYMDYHSSHFKDCSLMVFQNEVLIALFPANISEENIVYSHQGLSYGSLIYNPRKTLESTENNIYQAILSYYKTISTTKIIIKTPPVFYGSHIRRQINILTAVGAKVQKSFLSMAAHMEPPLKIHRSKLKRYRKCKEKNEFVVFANNDFKDFWKQVLIPCLKEKHQTKPVHELDEIAFLHSSFPSNIIQWNVYFENKIIAGITLFIKDSIIRSQYGATRLGYESLAPLDYLYIYLFDFYHAKGVKIFDMGSIPPNNDSTYPEGLVKYKKELGCVTYPQDQYEVLC